MVLLVHGFNNDEEEARASYYCLRQNLDTTLAMCGVGDAARETFQDMIWELYWPGYAPLSHKSYSGLKRAGIEQGLSSLSYSREVKKAKSWVPKGLAAFLRDIDPSDIFFIGHSLGCRVILETIAHPILPKSILLSGFILMAGAVPIHLLVKAGKLCDSSMRAKKRFCLHSWHDVVLAGAFPPGEMLAGEFPIYGLPVATGIAGSPHKFYDLRSNTRLGHSEYWTEGIFEGRAPYAELLATVLGIVPDRDVAASELLELPRMRFSRIIPTRPLAFREIAGTDWLSDRYGPDAVG